MRCKKTADILSDIRSFPFSARSASADNRERLRKQAFRAIPAQPFAERREDCQLPGAIEVQMFTPFEQSADERQRNKNFIPL